MHTVFSDGSVWPNIRVQEAQKDGVDFISTNEHLEYQPWKDDIPPPNRNRASQVAKEYGKAWGRPVSVMDDINKIISQGATLLPYGGDFTMLKDELERHSSELDQCLS